MHNNKETLTLCKHQMNQKVETCKILQRIPRYTKPSIKVDTEL